MKNFKLRTIVIGAVTILGFFFGYKVVVNPPVNNLKTTVVVDSLVVDTLHNDTLSTEK
jgi:hypothetical protein